MEADTAVSIFKKLTNSTTRVKALAGDDDDTVISRIQKEVDCDIEKWADLNHCKKSLRTNLEKLKSKHRQLNGNAIKYLGHCFGYAIAQNRNQPITLATAINATPLHSFGDHSLCDIGWCGYLQKLGPNLEGTKPYKHSSLNSDLTSPPLKVDLIHCTTQYCYENHKKQNVWYMHDKM